MTLKKARKCDPSLREDTINKTKLRDGSDIGITIQQILNAEINVLKGLLGTSLVVQWLRLRAPNAGDLGSIPGQGTRSHMHATTKSSHAATKEPACRN